MHSNDLSNWQHEHVFGQDQQKAGEQRTLLVVYITVIMMVIEIAAGVIYGSIALLADGLHMASHATALGIAVLAYVMARRLSDDQRFCFGVGKINSLAGFASAVLLLGFALVMVVKSADRLINPLEISFDQALIVAFVGLFVNGASAWVLASTPHDHGHDHHDHNLKGAYLHVLADALTSVLAIAALLAGKYLGAGWLDPIMGFVGAILVTRWSIGLIKVSSQVLLDHQEDEGITKRVRDAIEENNSDRVTDLHIWSIGHGIRAAEIAVVSHDPKSPEYYKTLVPPDVCVVHATVEVHQCSS